MAQKGDVVFGKFSSKRSKNNEYIDDGESSASGSCSKRSKLEVSDVDMFVSFLKDNVNAESLRKVLKIFSLGANCMTLCSLRLDNCYASSNLTFKEAGENIAYSKHKTTEVIPTNKLFRIGDIFTVGISVLHKYLRRENPVVPEDPAMRQALANLIQFVSIPGYLEDHAALCEPFTDEGELAVKLAQHLLVPLAVNSTYTVNDGYQHLKEKVASGQCLCNAHDTLVGRIGDTSFGCKFWHGSTDILMDGVVPVSISGIEESQTNKPKDHMSTSSSTSEKFTEKDIGQIISQTIAFSFLQLKENDLKSSLVPGIGISKKQLKVVFYDSAKDILLSTPSLDLLDVDKPHLTAIVLLWLTLNYKLFCTGVTKEMTSFEAGFFHGVSNDVREIYENEITMPYHKTDSENEEDDDSQWANHIILGESICHDTDDTGFMPLPI